jgi:hypothetical protein
MTKFLETARNPRGGKAGPPIPAYTLKHEDADAIVAYLRSLPCSFWYSAACRCRSYNTHMAPASRKAQHKPLAIVRRLATHLSLLAEAKAALADADLDGKTRSPLLTHSVQRALARQAASRRKAKRTKKRR